MEALHAKTVSSSMKIEAPQVKVIPEPSKEFVNTAYVQEITQRALTYLRVGYPVHLAGPAGTGKTTLAFHIAARLGQSVTLINGDDEFGSSDLVGRDAGYRKSKLVDNFIHSVLKTEENMNTVWVNNRLTIACQKGYTLIYDEFTRSRPEANNALLSVLEERFLNLPKLQRVGEGYLQVHPDFRAIFTSNPEEYAGVHKTQDALMDRLITIHVDHYDRDTEVEIVKARSSLGQKSAEIIVDIVRELRGIGANNHLPTIRASIAIARVLAHRGAKVHPDDPVFSQVCGDILNSGMAKVTHGGISVKPKKVDEIIRKFCGKSCFPKEAVSEREEKKWPPKK